MPLVTGKLEAFLGDFQRTFAGLGKNGPIVHGVRESKAFALCFGCKVSDACRSANLTGQCGVGDFGQTFELVELPDQSADRNANAKLCAKTLILIRQRCNRKRL